MKLLLYAVLVLVVLGGLFVVFEPRTSVPLPSDAPAPSTATAKTGTSETAPARPTVTPAAPGLESKVFELAVSAGRVVSGPTVIQVREGDDVTLRITVDTSDEIHLHGYDLRAKTRSGEMVTLHFVAQRTGRFAIELHGTDRELGALEVYPR